MKKKETILIVDDEPINLEFFDVMLSKLGFDVEKAESGEEALERIRDTRPDLIVLDNIMPGLTGWEVTRKLKSESEFEEYRTIPIIMFSAMDSVEDKIEGFELGVDDYITKPFNFSEVLARIRAVLRSKELSRQVMRRERRIAVIESLNKSLLFFTQHVRKPIAKLLDEAERARSSGGEHAERLAGLVEEEGHGILASLKGLEDEVGEMQSRESELKEGDLALEDLEERYRKHLIDDGLKKK